MLQQEDRKVPALEKMRSGHWDHILGLASKSSRKKYYQYLWQIEMRLKSKKNKKEQKKARSETKLSQRESKKEDPMSYKLNYNSMFLGLEFTTQ